MSPTPAPPDLTTFLTTVSCVVDDLYQDHCAHHKPRRPGRRPDLSDSEVLTLALLAQWWPTNSERAFCAYVAHHWRAYFPRLLDSSALNRRIRDMGGVLAVLTPLVAETARRVLGFEPPPYAVLDGAPVPLMQRCRGPQQRVFTHEAAIGKGGPQKDWFYGLKALVVVDPEGFITGLVSGPANTDERLLVEALLRFRWDPRAPLPSGAQLTALLGPTHAAGGGRRGPTGPIGPRLSAGRPCPERLLLGDLGFRGDAWHTHWEHDLHASVVTERTLATAAQRDGDRALLHAYHGARQVVERTIGSLEHQFHLAYPRARSLGGLWARLAAKAAAHNLLRFLNGWFGRPLEAHFNPFLT
jgi:hypothetical protein